MAKQKNLYDGPVSALFIRQDGPGSANTYSDCFHIYARFVTYDATKAEDEQVQFIARYGERWLPKRDLCLDDLYAWSQGDAGTGSRLYGWQLRYKSYAVDFEDVERMHRTMKYLHAGLDREKKRTGPPMTFGGWICRVALAAKATAIVLETGEGDDRFKPYLPGEAIWHIDRLESQQYWCNQKQEETAAA